MGKYIRKSKIDEESIALMDVSPSSSLGVLTRAKSLALKRRLQRSSSSASLPTSPSPKRKQKQQITDCGGSYLQLRSRRLQKKPPIVVIRSSKRRNQQRRKEACGRNPNPNSQNFKAVVNSIRESLCDESKFDSVSESSVCEKHSEINKNQFGEKFVELEGSESFNKRTTRESTPCSLVKQPEMMIISPESSIKLNNVISDNNNKRRDHLPTTPEMDEFFSGAEEEQQKLFIEKYNFDPVNEQPLPGRFEWKKIDD